MKNVSNGKHENAVVCRPGSSIKRTRKTINIVLLSACVFLCAMLLFGCGGQKYLDVSSIDYPDLHRLYLRSLDDPDVHDEMFQEPYYWCFVKLTDTRGDAKARLVIANDRAFPRIHTAYGDNGYFVGSDYSEFASGISFFPYTGLDIAEFDVDELPTGRCVGLFNLTENGVQSCYAVTSWNLIDEDELRGISLYRLDYPKDRHVGCQKICDIAEDEYACASVMDDSGKIYVAASHALYAVETSGKVEKINFPDKWRDIAINSIVKSEDKLYMGTVYGVLEYDTATGEYSWYQPEYSELGYKK